MNFFIRIIALLLLSTLVFAFGGQTFTVDPPVVRTDSTPLANDEIQEYRVYCDGGVAPTHVQPNVPLNTDTLEVPPGTFSPGDHSCVSAAVDTFGQEGPMSNVVNFTVPLPAPPGAPGLAIQ